MRSTSTTWTSARCCRSHAPCASRSTGDGYASAPPAPPTRPPSSACSTSSGSWSGRLQPLAEPALHGGRRRALELRVGRAAQQVLRLHVELVALEAQVSGDRSGHLQRRIVRVDRARRLGEQLVGLLDRGDRLVAVLEMRQEARERVVGSLVIDDVDGAPGHLRQGQGLGLCGHTRALPGGYETNAASVPCRRSAWPIAPICVNSRYASCSSSWWRGSSPSCRASSARCS